MSPEDALDELMDAKYAHRTLRWRKQTFMAVGPETGWCGHYHGDITRMRAHGHGRKCLNGDRVPFYSPKPWVLEPVELPADRPTDHAPRRR